MKTFQIKRGSKINFDPRVKFYLDQASVSIKKVGQSSHETSAIFRFKITYLSTTADKSSFNIELLAPYYFIIARADSSFYKYKGPYNLIEIESMKENPDLIIQVGFTNLF